ncbi:MAG: glycosyltransferase family 4 protein [Planctomycetia bacterium]|nr:glycosyltransferase family 4 protein [Planctomycetia bacterium]
MHIALITAGGAGMFCGSCMHDNTLARALIAAGHEVSLIPTYTPIRVDEQDVSARHVYLGGINVYLDALIPLWNRLPRAATRWLDAPWLIRLVTQFALSTSANKLGRLTVALLEGDQGPQAREIDELVRHVGEHLKPDVVCFSNALLAGVLPRLKQVYAGPVVCILQGDDIFLNDLIEPYREQALKLLRQHAKLFDRFLVHSAYYRDSMAKILGLDRARMHVVPLGIDLAGHDGVPRGRPGDPLTIGYFARICPEKGLHALVDAFRIVHEQHPRTRLVAAGYLGPRDQEYFRDIQRRAADLGDAFHYAGSPPGHVEKVEFLKSLDILSVPTTYREPKGLYVLEALANGVPVVQPRHGAFPEMLAATGGGVLVNPDDPVDLARGLSELIADPARRFELATRGRDAVRAGFNTVTMAEKTVAALK